MAIHNILKVCSVLPALLVMPAMAETIKAGETLDVSGTITGKTDNVYVNDGTLNITSGTVFKDNHFEDASDRVGLIANHANLVIGDNVTFKDNSAFYSGGSTGTAIYSEAGNQGSLATITIGDNVKFVNNKSYQGGAMFLFGANKLTIGKNALFDGNVADWYGSTGYSGGAINVHGSGNNNVYGDTDGTIINIDKDATFSNNKARYGGAIYLGIPKSSLTLAAGTEFKNNIAEASSSGVGGHGGAIYNTDTVTATDVDFVGNQAAQGGAIYNGIGVHLPNDEVTPLLTINGGDFELNTASGRGGAIYNAGTMTITGTAEDMVDFEQNSSTGSGGAIAATGKTTIEYAEFEGNKSGSYGGAIFAGEGAELTVRNSKFVNNNSAFVGALSTGTQAKDTIIENTEFTGNTADEVGAVALYKNTKMTSVKLSGNKALSKAADSDGAGALFLGAESTTVIDGASYFANNESGTHGGAISMRGVKEGDNTAAKLDILGTEQKAIEFTNNTAVTKGGAIFSTFYNNKDNINSVYLNHVVFTGNTAAEGGAIYNAGDPDRGGNLAKMVLENVTFTNNTATTAGGAILVDGDGAVTLQGTNTFSGNTAAKIANDIHNLGTVTIAGGETTIAGGITGTGDIEIDEGAILNIGTTTVNATTLTLDGTLNATIQKNGRDGGTPVFAKLLADTIDGDGILNLTISSAGEYKMFKNTIGDDITVNFGDIYNGEIKGDTVSVTTKSVTEIADATGLTQNSAAIVSGLANSDSASLASLSTRVQQELAGDNVAYVESELAKANPDAAPVAQSMSMSVQGQVMNLAAGRMGGGAIALGRAGGESVDVGYGMWAQGLFNKSKLNGEFHGYTRGFAVGADALIDKVWTLGVGAAFNSTDVHAKNARNTDIDTTALFIYGQYKPSNWYVNATVNYAMADYSEKVEILGVPLAGDYNIDSFGGQIMTGYDMAFGLTPEAGIRYLHIDEVTSDNGLTRVGTDASDYLTAIAGMKYAFTINTPIKNATDLIVWRPELRAAATYDMLSDAAQSTVATPGVLPYVLDGQRLSRFGGEFGLGLSMLYHGLEVSVNYELDLHEDYTSQTGMLKFRYDF